MSSVANNLQSVHSHGQGVAVRSAVELGALIREQRKHLDLRQLEVAGMGNTGNRFIVELENGKPTVQLQKVLDVLDLLGLEVVVQAKATRMR